MSATRDSTVIIHRALRERILSGDLEPGARLAQARVADELGVSRGPVREAFRLLEREGLILAEVNLRARVAPLHVEDLEQLYATRIVTESLGIAVSVPRFSADEIAAVERDLDEMDALAAVDLPAWELVHGRFHRALVAHAGERIARSLADAAEHVARYLRVYVTGDPRAWSQGAQEHRGIVAACAARDPAAAATALARHLAHTATTVIALAGPEHDPRLVAAAVAQVEGGRA